MNVTINIYGDSCKRNPTVPTKVGDSAPPIDPPTICVPFPPNDGRDYHLPAPGGVVANPPVWVLS
jgi:hypothetical protein